MVFPLMMGEQKYTSFANFKQIWAESFVVVPDFDWNYMHTGIAGRNGPFGRPPRRFHAKSG